MCHFQILFRYLSGNWAVYTSGVWRRGLYWYYALRGFIIYIIKAKSEGKRSCKDWPCISVLLKSCELEEEPAMNTEKKWPTKNVTTISCILKLSKLNYGQLFYLVCHQCFIPGSSALSLLVWPTTVSYLVILSPFCFLYCIHTASLSHLKHEFNLCHFFASQ